MRVSDGHENLGRLQGGITCLAVAPQPSEHFRAVAQRARLGSAIIGESGDLRRMKQFGKCLLPSPEYKVDGGAVVDDMRGGSVVA
jgi:hypothetical protein